MAVNLINRTTTDYLEFKDGVYYYKGPDKGAGKTEAEEGSSGYRVLDKYCFKRAGMYRHFTEDCKCSVSMTARIDVTELAEYSRSRGTKFYLNFLYILCKVLNSSEDYRMGYLWQSDELIVYDKINPTQYAWREEYGTCTPVYTEYYEDYEAFYKQASEDLEYAKSTKDYLLDSGAHPNWFDASCIPWVSYDSLNVELPDGYLYFLPIINWGRYRQEEGRLMMPVTVRLNHAVADGFTVANVFRLLEREIRIFCDNDLRLSV
ncbi:MAG: chloramphenicol acetyltransferase [Clostridiales bacterium]|nr:chloramphenicol acetyltransferase [Clostridiales bacterium]